MCEGVQLIPKHKAGTCETLLTADTIIRLIVRSRTRTLSPFDPRFSQSILLEKLCDEKKFRYHNVKVYIARNDVDERLLLPFRPNGCQNEWNHSHTSLNQITRLFNGFAFLELISTKSGLSAVKSCYTLDVLYERFWIFISGTISGEKFWRIFLWVAFDEKLPVLKMTGLWEFLGFFVKTLFDGLNSNFLNFILKIQEKNG